MNLNVVMDSVCPHLQSVIGLTTAVTNQMKVDVELVRIMSFCVLAMASVSHGTLYVMVMMTVAITLMKRDVKDVSLLIYIIQNYSCRNKQKTNN